MNQPIELSLEQEFSLRTFSDQVQQMSREQAQEFLQMLYTALPAAMRYILKAESYTRRGVRRKTVLHNSGKRCKQMMIRETTYQELLKHQWEVGSGSILG